MYLPFYLHPVFTLFIITIVFALIFTSSIYPLYINPCIHPYIHPCIYLFILTLVFARIFTSFIYHLYIDPCIYPYIYILYLPLVY